MFTSVGQLDEIRLREIDESCAFPRCTERGARGGIRPVYGPVKVRRSSGGLSGRADSVNQLPALWPTAYVPEAD